MRLNVGVTAPVVSLFLCGAMIVVSPEAATAETTSHVRFCPLLKDVMLAPAAFFERKTTYNVEGFSDCRISKGTVLAKSNFISCRLPILEREKGQEAYDKARQMVSDCITNIRPANLLYAQSTKGVVTETNKGISTRQDFAFDGGKHKFGLFLMLNENQVSADSPPIQIELILSSERID